MGLEFTQIRMTYSFQCSNFHIKGPCTKFRENSYFLATLRSCIAQISRVKVSHQFIHPKEENLGKIMHIEPIIEQIMEVLCG